MGDRVMLKDALVGRRQTIRLRLAPLCQMPQHALKSCRAAQTAAHLAPATSGFFRAKKTFTIVDGVTQCAIPFVT
jgi:hypothetical protein